MMTITALFAGACDGVDEQQGREDAALLDDDIDEPRRVVAAPDDGEDEEPEVEDLEPIIEEELDLAILPDDPLAASCIGYDYGGNFCLASCWDNPGYWVAVGHKTNTTYGQCGDKVNSYCAWHGGRYGACWGSN